MLAMQTAMSAQMKDMRDLKLELLTQMEDLKNEQPKRRRDIQTSNSDTTADATTHNHMATAVYAQEPTMPTLELIRPAQTTASTVKACCSVAQNKPTETRTCCGASAAAGGSNTGTCNAHQPTVITELVTAATKVTEKKKGNAPLLPHLFVIRGSKREKIAVGEASMPEYIAALCKMSKDPEVPDTWREPLAEHIHNLAVMACEWEWNTCRLWSEKVFDMIDDGRLPHAWSDHYAVKDIQRDAYAVGNRITVTKYHRPTAHNPRQTAAPTPVTTYNTAQTNYTATTENRQDFNRDTDGKPCTPWNWGSDCGFSTSHGEASDRKVHVCAWCANKYRRANVHKEKDCLNKKRFLDKKAAQAADTLNQQNGQGF